MTLQCLFNLDSSHFILYLGDLTSGFLHIGVSCDVLALKLSVCMIFALVITLQCWSKPDSSHFSLYWDLFVMTADGGGFAKLFVGSLPPKISEDEVFMLSFFFH